MMLVPKLTASAQPDNQTLIIKQLTSIKVIQIVLYQNTNQKITEAYNKWFPRVVNTETIGLDKVAEHMASHNTPFSKGAILGMLTDFVSCTKELLLLGKTIKIPDLAILSLGLKVKGGVEKKDDFSVTKNIEGLRLRARATGELKTSNLDTTIKRIDLAEKQSSTGGNTTPTTPSGGSSSTGGGSSSGTGGSTGSGSDSGGDDNQHASLD